MHPYDIAGLLTHHFMYGHRGASTGIRQEKKRANPPDSGGETTKITLPFRMAYHCLQEKERIKKEI
ncbi:MAG: hypothetical protein WBA22_07370 [Candidatus Methanofastidiosia archaeon]